METIWWLVVLGLATWFAFYVGVRTGSGVLMGEITKRAKRRMTVEEYKAFKGLIVSLLIKEEGD